jgi:endo-1,4-beta-xylanase
MMEARTSHGHGRWLLAVAALSLLALVVGAAVRAQPAVAAASTLRAAADARGLFIGTAVQASALASNATYAAGVNRDFNSVTAENEMKWSSLEATRGVNTFGPADAIVAFARAHNENVRGHNLVWHQQIPSWVTNGNFTAAQLTAVMQQHIATVAGHFKGQVVSWDVVNEPFNDDGTMRSDIWTNTIGPSYIATALTAAHAADPAAKLYLNDFNIEGVNAKSTAMLNLISSLKQQGVPIDGVGLESHFIVGGVPSTMQQNIARFAALGVAVWVTELDDRMTLPSTPALLAQQATDYVRVVNACLAVTGCVGITVWEYEDGLSWVPGAFSGQGAADLYDANFQPKPAYPAVLTALGGSQVSPSPSGSPTATPTATPTPTPTTTPTATPTPTPSGTPGGVTVTPVINQSSPFFDEEDVRVANTGTLSALTVAIVVQATQGVSFSGQYNTVGGQVTQSHSSTSGQVTFTFTLSSGQTLPAGTGRLFAGQLSGSGTTHVTTADTFTVTATSAGATTTQTGHF